MAYQKLNMETVEVRRFLDKRLYPCRIDFPSGLFGETICKLSVTENHRHAGWGQSGMVYWALQSLRKLAEVETDKGKGG